MWEDEWVGTQSQRVKQKYVGRMKKVTMELVVSDDRNESSGGGGGMQSTGGLYT